MSLELDEETLAELGWGSEVGVDADCRVHFVSAPKPSRTAPGQIDGRSRRNWRHRRNAAQSPETGHPATFDHQGEELGHG